MPQSTTLTVRSEALQKPSPPIHPLAIRITHWINAFAMIVMILSGWGIHNAYPTLPFAFPEWMTLGGSFPGALRWHFAAMWLLVINGGVYLAYGFLTDRFRRKLFPIWPGDVLRDALAAMSGKLDHEDLSTYNAVQRALYAGVIAAGVLAIITGLAIWKPVQLKEITLLFGDFDNARIMHFAAMCTIVGFLAVHVTMSLIVPKSLRAMIIGR
ncbi:cytochrome b/b6 domain-containing protein [Hyphomicrobium sp.]|uniref:cytochrome b/b6 domain-containing protein n=1 Tax=Hyphomicrobium sp. TaxID=82 RepID=UPI000F97BD33|nr:cytochrome b/b6 domain-containing protein [Hyphomicrobium sp.]RUP00366.1 MAG: cytochrome b/b6 domain-containing protein [Hyphomicrobium sp.]